MALPAIVRRYAASGWRHRWKALILAWLICIPGWIAVSMMPNQYQANARIYADPEALLGTLLKGLAADSSPARQVEMLQRTLLSRPNLERVIARTDLDMRVRDTASRERLIESLSRDIKITLQTRQLFRIDYTDSDPRIVYEVVRTVIALFMEAATSNDRQQMQSARTFLQHQITSYEVQLREAEQRRAEFRARYSDILPSENLGGGTRLEQAREKLGDLRGSLTDEQTKRDLLRKQIEAIPAAAPAASGGTGGGRLAEAERQLRELRLRYTDQHPEVVAQRAVVNELRASGGGGGGGSGTAAPRPGGGTPNPLYEQLRLRLIDADAQVSSLERQVVAMEAEVVRLQNLARQAPHVQAEFQNIDRDYAVLRKNYEELLARREALQIAGAARTDGNPMRLEVVEPPTVPIEPIGPNRMLFSIGVLAAGVGAGVALMLLLVTLDSGFYTIHDLRSIGLPVLGGVSSAAAPPRRVMASLAFAAGFLILLGAFGAFQVVGPKIATKLPELLTRLMA